MSTAIKLRLAAFVLAIVVVALIIGWAAQQTWSETRQMTGKVNAAQVESFEIADHFQAVVLDLNARILRYPLSSNPAEAAGFKKECEDLRHWLQTESQKLNNPRERKVLDSVHAAFQDYCAQALLIFGQSKPATEASLAFQAQTKKLLSMGNLLADAHREVMGQLIAGTHQSLRFLQQLIFGLLFLLLALGAGLVVLVYREMITPLRRKLVESHAIIERQEKLASLGVLAAGVAHEIRNPLTAIKARLFTQRKFLKPGTTEWAGGEVIGQEINRLERIVRDFLLFARPSEPRFEMIPADRPLREVLAFLTPQLEKIGIRLILNESPQATVQADPEQIKQVLINLVQNAADSIGRDGIITLRLRLDTMRLGNRQAEVAILEVADTGKGIPPEIQKRLFDPFFTTKGGGTGLGLSIAARIVEKHHGALQYQTKPEQGTTFGIVLPRA